RGAHPASSQSDESRVPSRQAPSRHAATTQNENEPSHAKERATARGARSPPFSTTAPRMVRAERPRSALAADQRSVSHPRVGSNAAADTGGSRPAEIRRMAGEVPDARGAG